MDYSTSFLFIFFFFWTSPCLPESVSGLFYYYQLYIPILYATRVDLDQTPRSVASDLGLHYLAMSFSGALGINGSKGVDTLNIFHHF